MDYDFPYIGNVMIPTDFHSIIFQRGWWLNHQPDIVDGLLCYDLCWTVDTHMLHGAGIFTNICPCPKSPSFVGKYTSSMVRIWGWL